MTFISPWQKLMKPTVVSGKDLCIHEIGSPEESKGRSGTGPGPPRQAKNGDNTAKED
jgi:hypothetical protein